MDTHHTPTAVCVAIFGSFDNVGRLCGPNAKIAYHWRHEVKGRDAGDIPSSRHIRVLLGAAIDRGVALDLRHLIYGATEDEMADILASVPMDAPAPEMAAQ